MPLPQLAYTQHVNSIKGDIQKHMKGGTKLLLHSDDAQEIANLIVPNPLMPQNGDNLPANDLHEVNKALDNPLVNDMIEENPEIATDLVQNQIAQNPIAVNQAPLNPVVEESLKKGLDTVRDTTKDNVQIRSNDRDVIIPDANCELASYMEPYAESMDKPPIYESHVSSPYGKMLSLYIHSFVGFRFTGIHPLTHKLGRYYVRAGFGGKGNDKNEGTRKATWSAGGLHNDTFTRADISLQRNTTVDVINKGLKFVPALARNSNYNLFLHNCNHFAREVALELGFGDVADMHDGMSPTTTYANMAKNAQNGEEGYFCDYTTKDGLQKDSATVKRKDEYDVYQALNNKIDGLNTMMLYEDQGPASDFMSITKNSFLSEANGALNSHGLNFRFNNRQQFATKGQARAVINEVADKITAVESALPHLKLSLVNLKPNLKKDEPMDSPANVAAINHINSIRRDCALRISDFQVSALDVQRSARDLMRKSGKRYYKLGRFALMAATSFERLSDRVVELAKDSGIDNISRNKSFTIDATDAEIISLFNTTSDTEVDTYGKMAEKNMPTKAEDIGTNVYTNKYDVDESKAAARVGFILSGLPNFQSIFDVKHDRKRGSFNTASTEESVLYAAETASMMLSKLKTVLNGGNPQYLNAIALLYRNGHTGFTNEQLAHLLTSEFYNSLLFGVKNSGESTELIKIFTNMHENSGFYNGSYAQVKNILTPDEGDPRVFAANAIMQEMPSEFSKAAEQTLTEKYKEIAFCELDLFQFFIDVFSRLIPPTNVQVPAQGVAQNAATQEA